MDGPLVVPYGTAELRELCRQSLDCAQPWVKRGLPGHLLPVDGANHFTILESLADPQFAFDRYQRGNKQTVEVRHVHIHSGGREWSGS
jgi:hypothetical protein